MNKLMREMFEVLKSFELSSNDMNGRGPYCPKCHAYMGQDHKPDCRLHNVLAKCEKVFEAEELLKPQS